MHDYTNIPNEFQGSLRYAFLETKARDTRIDNDWTLVKNDKRFYKTLAVTHCNEFPDLNKDSTYISNNPFIVNKK
jgi:hypothetical protein